jgi:hypothetical protein
LIFIGQYREITIIKIKLQLNKNSIGYTFGNRVDLLRWIKYSLNALIAKVLINLEFCLNEKEFFFINEMI